MECAEYAERYFIRRPIIAQSAEQKQKSNLIIFEMVTFDESEWQLIKTLKNEFSIPIIVYVKNEESAHAIMSRLLKIGIREIAITIERERILNIVERNLRNPF